MRAAVQLLAAGLMAVVAAPVEAADWWLISGVPSDPMAIFADAASLTRHHHSAQMVVLRIDRFGQATETLQQIRCNLKAGSREEEVVQKFACAPDNKRDRHGLMLQAIDPLMMAQMIFDSSDDEMAPPDEDPST